MSESPVKKWVFLRRISQTVFFSLFIYVLWSTTYPLKGMISPELLFKIDPLVVFLTSACERVLVPGIIASSVMLVLTLVFGRFFCGWICPLGAMIDWAGALRGRQKKGLEDRINGKIRKPKFTVLAIITALAIAGFQAAWVFDPMVIAARFVSLNFIPAFTLTADRLLSFLITGFHLYGAPYDVYRELKVSVLGVNTYFFSNSGILLAYFLSIVLPSLWMTRIWCRTLCPLGALYSLVAKKCLLERRVSNCIKCGKCQGYCRMGAIADDLGYWRGECILCMDCVYDCPPLQTRFTFPGRGRKSAELKEDGGITRKQFILLSALSLPFLGWSGKPEYSGEKPEHPGGRVIRPPGALDEPDFLDRCIRCGNCMKVCITNGLQPVALESGWEGVWTPQLVPEIGYCEYNCTLCGNVCPTGAIVRLSAEEKKQKRLGTAYVDRKRCIAWANNEQCIVCEEHCPVPEKAIMVREGRSGAKKIFKPVVNEKLCIGCGVCQNVCPVRPVRAIRVRPR